MTEPVTFDAITGRVEAPKKMLPTHAPMPARGRTHALEDDALPDEAPVTPKERLRLRMTEWLIRAGLPVKEAQSEAKNWVKASPDPKWDLDVMRQIEEMHRGA